VREEDVEHLGDAGTVARHRGETQLPRSRAEVAHHVLGPAYVDLDTGGVASERVGGGEVELLGDEALERLVGVEAPARRSAERPAELPREPDRAERRRQRAAGAPEANQHGAARCLVSRSMAADLWSGRSGRRPRWESMGTRA